MDYCTIADEELLPLTDCFDVVETTGNYRYLCLLCVITVVGLIVLKCMYSS